MRDTKYSRSQMRSKLVLQLLNRIRPFERLSGLIVASDEIEDRLLQRIETSKMVGLEKLALEKTEPDLNLVEKGGHFSGANRAAWSASPPTSLIALVPNGLVA